MSTPGFMPRLSGGCHNDPAEGACVMEYISFITGDVFTDTPACTPRNLAILAQYVNDSLSSDEARAQHLTPLIPRLLGAGQSEGYDKRLPQFLYGLARTEDTGKMDNFNGPTHRQCQKNVYSAFSILTTIRNTEVDFRLNETPEQYYARRDAVCVSILVDALDDYDLFLKREKPESLTPAQVDAVEHLTALITS